MASVFHLCNDAFHIKQEIVDKYTEFAAENKRLYFAAVAIQRTWRGYHTRKIIQNWNNAATTIQRYARGFLVRWRLPLIYDEHFKYMSLKYYNQQAAKIQALWKGYKLRKKLSVKKNFEERARLAEVTEEMRAQIAALFKDLKDEQFNQEVVAKRTAMKNCLEYLFDRHHLLRTIHREGVLSIHGSNELSQIEKVLKSLSFRDYINEMRKITNKAEDSVPIDDFIFFEKKSFDLNTSKIKEKAYERMLMTQHSDPDL